MWRKTIENVSLLVVSTGLGEIADLMVPLATGPAWVFLTLGAAIIWIIVRHTDDIDAWWSRGRSAPDHAADMDEYVRATPMEGIDELERCHQALVKYMAIPSQRMVGSAHIAGSAELYPYMTELCRILDEQEIPRPEIDYHLQIVGTGAWARFLGDLWAVRHDIERARRVYRN